MVVAKIKDSRCDYNQLLLGANPRRIPKMGQQQGTETKVFFCVGQVVVVAAAAHDCILALLHHHDRIDVHHIPRFSFWLQRVTTPPKQIV